MERRSLLGAAAGVLLLAIGSCVPGWVLGPKVAGLQLEEQDLTQTLVVNGRVLAPRRVNLGLSQSGQVARRLVDEGDRVKAGTLLLALDDGETRAAVAQAEARLQQVRDVSAPSGAAGLLQAEATLAQAGAAFQRQERLFREGVLSASQLDEARRNLDVAKASADAARVQATSARVGAEVRLAEGTLAAARARQEQMLLRAPADGVVLQRHVDVGDVVTPGKSLFEFMPDASLQLVVQPDEKHLAQLQVGQRALASADAFPDVRFACDVCYIGPSVDLQRGTVDVKLKVPEPPAFLRSDMTVSVEIQQGRRPRALCVPLVAVRGLPGPAHVLVHEQGKATKRSVRLGLRGERAWEVLEGLRSGESVVLDPAVQAGARVRLRKAD